jgi:FMN phosphatase YigB (HAD superfamily)
MIKIILFDIDNTLIDHTSAEKKAILEIHDKYFKEQISQDHFKKLWMEKTKKNWKLFEEQRLTFKQQQEQRIIDIWNYSMRESSRELKQEIQTSENNELHSEFKPKLK